jgi:ABC-2 type transport system permease protein
VISGFRYGFIGVADSPVLAGALVLLGANVVLGAITYAMLETGWKLKA